MSGNRKMMWFICIWCDGQALGDFQSLARTSCVHGRQLSGVGRQHQGTPIVRFMKLTQGTLLITDGGINEMGLSRMRDMHDDMIEGMQTQWVVVRIQTAMGIYQSRLRIDTEFFEQSHQQQGLVFTVPVAPTERFLRT